MPSEGVFLALGMHAPRAQNARHSREGGSVALSNAIRAATMTLAVCLAVVVAQGCRAHGGRPGAILCGEWGLGPDRYPSSCNENDLSEEANKGGSDQAVPCGACAGSGRMGPIIPPIPDGRGRLLRQFRHGRARPVAAPKPVSADVASDGHPRFHLVPTAPVFSPRDLPYGVGAAFGPIPAGAPDMHFLQLATTGEEAIEQTLPGQQP